MDTWDASGGTSVVKCGSVDTCRDRACRAFDPGIMNDTFRPIHHDANMNQDPLMLYFISLTCAFRSLSKISRL